MLSCLPINVINLLNFQGVESARVEFKASWDENYTGIQVLHTICAFANDFQNLSGGYIVIGVAEEHSQAVLPPKGLTTEELDAASNWIRGKCNTLDPAYSPVFSPEMIDDKRILVIWCPASQMRPHRAIESLEKNANRRYYIRIGSSTLVADKKTEWLNQLMQLTAKVPFDDRRAQNATVLDIRETKVREFLNDVQSNLLDEPDTRTLYRKLRISEPVNGHDAPRNIGLLFFSQNPEQWFNGARIEVVQFSADASGSIIGENIYTNMPIHEQLREALAFLEGLSVRLIQKLPRQTQATHWVSYPSLALREALVNAVYHRSYEGVADPIKVYLYPDRLEIISYPGPVPGIELEHLNGDKPLPPVPARNRRIGEFLKELKMAEGRGTGIPRLRRAMKQNGSQPAKFDFDEKRTYFRVTLPAHPEYTAILALQDVANLRIIGESQEAFSRLKEAFLQAPFSLGIALELSREYINRGDIHSAEDVYAKFVSENPGINAAALITLIASALLDKNRRQDATKWLDKLHLLDAVEDAFDAAIQEKRAGRLERAHRYFQVSGDAVKKDVKALHEFAQVKISLARKNKYTKSSNILLDEAKEMLQRVVQMDAPKTRHAWAWYNLGQVMSLRKFPKNEVRKAFQNATSLDPEEHRFSDALNRLDQ